MEAPKNEAAPEPPSAPATSPTPVPERRSLHRLLFGPPRDVQDPLGVHALLTVQRTFPGFFKNFVFVSVGVVDSAAMKGIEEVDRIRARTRRSLEQYADLAHRLKLAAESRMEVCTEAVAEAEKLCVDLAQEFPRAVFFAGKLVFEKEHWYQRLLHNESAYALQRRLQFDGLNAMVMPVRVLEGA